jgi:hypothetical protein
MSPRSSDDTPPLERSSETSRIHVERQASGYADRARSYRVVLDATRAGRVGFGDICTFEASPGHHVLHLAIDWCRSRSVELDLAAGQEVRLQCWPNARPWAWPYWVTFGSRNYIGIKHLGVGDAVERP